MDPAGHEPVQPPDGPRRFQQPISSRCQFACPAAQALHARLGRACAHAGSARIPTIVASNPVARKAEGFPRDLHGHRRSGRLPPPAAAGAGWKRWASPTTFQPRRKRRRDRLLRSRESGAPCGVPYGPGTGAAQRAESGRSHPTSPRPRPRGGPCAPAKAPSLHRHSPASPVRRASPPPRPAWPVGPVGAGHATDGASLPSSVRAAPTPPAQPTGAGARGARFPTDASLPRSADGSASASPVSRPEACSAFTRVAARTVAQAALGGLLHRSASIGCLPSISRSDCDRLERQWPGGIRTR